MSAAYTRVRYERVIDVWMWRWRCTACSIVVPAPSEVEARYASTEHRKIGHQQRVFTPRGEGIRIILEEREAGTSWHHIARSLGVSISSLTTQLRRSGYDRLARQCETETRASRRAERALRRAAA